MDKHERFLRNTAKEPHNKRARRRLMERELKKLNGGQSTKDTGGDNGLDDAVS
jgi:hypothetical protein